MRDHAPRVDDGPLARSAEKQAEDAAHGRHPTLDARPERGAAPVPGVGSPLAEPVRSAFEERLGGALDGVEIHSGPAAARAAAERHSRGYTVGGHVVLGEEDPELLAHELAHAVQQRRAGITGVQHDDEPRTGGIGRTPPSVAYDVTREPAPGEDFHVLFGRDSATVPELALAGLLPLLPGGAQPVRVDVDGYASREGEGEYNLNLSAHRAAAIREALLLVLPAGSEVVLHAHGETAAFGAEPGGNQRAGLRITPIAPRPVVAPPSLFPSRRFGLTPDYHLELDPSLFIQPWLLDGPSPAVTVPATPPRFDPFRPVLPPVLPPPFVPRPEGPEEGPRFDIRLFPGLSPTRPTVDWSGIRTSMGWHGGIGIDSRLGDSIQATVESEYARYRGLGLGHDLAERLANMTASSEVVRQLTREGNTAIDRDNNDLARMGVSTLVLPVLTPEVLDRIRRVFGGGSR